MNRHFVDYLAPAPTYAAMSSDPAKTPSQIAEELAAERARLQAEDAKTYAGMTPPAPAKSREEPYRPEGFGYAHVDHKGHQGEVIPARPAPLGTLWQPEGAKPASFKDREQAAFEAWLISDEPSGDAEAVQHQWAKSWARAEFLESEQPAAPPAPAVDVPEGATHRGLISGRFYRADGGAVQLFRNGCWETTALPLAADLDGYPFEPLTQPAAPTEWQSSEPPSAGWYDTNDGSRIHDIEARYWNCEWWSTFAAADDHNDAKLMFATERTAHQITWRGPRLVGPAWPEPTPT